MVNRGYLGGGGSSGRGSGVGMDGEVGVIVWGYLGRFGCGEDL